MIKLVDKTDKIWYNRHGMENMDTNQVCGQY